MRIEDISKEALADTSNVSLHALRLQFVQVGTKFRKMQRAEPLITVKWTELRKRYELLITEFGKRNLSLSLLHPANYLKVSLSGIYLVKPHANLIWTGEKTLIIKAKNFKNMIGRSLILVSGDKAYGVIKLSAPKAISPEEFSALEPEHKISEEEREEWWPGKKILFAYQFTLTAKYPEPRTVHVAPGTQTFIQEVEFEKKLTWGLPKPAYRIFELADLGNTPGFTERGKKVVVEAKFDGARTKIQRKGGEVTIFTDPEDTATPNKTKRLPPQVEELEKLSGGDYEFDTETVIVKGNQALHRTAVNALINGKFDPTEASKQAHIYIFDVLESNGIKTTSWPLKERKEELNKYKDSEHIHFVRSTTRLEPSLSFIIKLPIAQNALDIVSYGGKPKFISEGAMIKLLDAPYSGKTWVKYKLEFEVDALVIEEKPVKGSPGVNSFELAVGPISTNWAEAIRKKGSMAVVEFNGKFYNRIGWSSNSKQKVSVGSILRISAEDVNRYETEDPKYPYYTTYIARVKQPVPERNSPDGMPVLERLSTLTPRRKKIRKNIDSDIKDSVDAGRIPKLIYAKYAKPGHPLPQKFYTNYRSGHAWAQTHIRGLETNHVEAYKKKEISLAELMQGHSIHIDLRMDLGLERLIQFVITDNDVESYLRYLTGASREIAGGKRNVQHSLAIVKPSAEEPQTLKKDREILAIAPKAAKALAEIQIIKNSYFIPPGGIGATKNTYSWMGLVWEGIIEAGIQRKDFHEYFLHPNASIPKLNKTFFNGRFIFKALRGPKSARWETWKAATSPKPADPILHRDGGYYYPVKASEIIKFGREDYTYGKKG